MQPRSTYALFSRAVKDPNPDPNPNPPTYMAIPTLDSNPNPNSIVTEFDPQIVHLKILLTLTLLTLFRKRYWMLKEYARRMSL